MHATNEQCALIMGWHLSGGYWVDAQGKWVDEYVNTIDSGCEYWNPIDNLNHAALVEARLAELELVDPYMIELAARTISFLPQITESTQLPVGYGFLLATADAQTRCDAAWATWRQYQQDKEQAK